MRKFISILLVLVLVFSLSAVALTTGSEKTAALSQTVFVMDGKTVTFDKAYNIENSNYIQLRSVAQMLSGTNSQFNVYWDAALGQAVIETGLPYTGVKKPVVVEKDEYHIGDKVIIKNTAITITDVFTTTKLPCGDSFIQTAKDKIFFCFTLTVLTSNPYLTGRISHIPHDFIEACNGETGKRYGSFNPIKTSDYDIYRNEETTMALRFMIPATEKITTITISDGAGTTETVYVY